MRIRNLKQLTFLNLFDTYHQRQWVSQLDYTHTSGIKYDNSAVREQLASQFKTLQEKPYVRELIHFLAAYVNATIPNYLASEFNFWNITCLPKYLKEDKVVSQISIHAVSVLFIYEEDDGSLGVMVYVSKLPFLNHISQGNSLEFMIEKLPSLQIECRDAFESQTQGEFITLFLNQADIEKAILTPLIRASCRLFNLRMMNRTGTEVKYRRTVWHCLDLADSIHGVILSKRGLIADN